MNDHIPTPEGTPSSDVRGTPAPSVRRVSIHTILATAPDPRAGVAATSVAARSERFGRLLRIGLLGIVLTLLGLMPMWMMPREANALYDGEGRFVLGIGTEPEGLWIGAFAPPDNLDGTYPIFCTHMWRANPQPHHTATVATLTEAKNWGPDELDLTVPQMAWLLGVHQFDATSRNRAALGYLIHANFEQPDPDRGHGDAGATISRLVELVRAQHPDVDSLAQEYVKEARRSAATGYESGVVEGDGARVGSLNGLGVLGEEGWIAGAPLEVTLDGPAVFDETGTNRWTGTSGDGPISLAWRATGNGKVTSVITYKETPRQTLTLAHVDDRHQETLTASDRPVGDPVDRRLDGPYWRVLFDFQPEAVSNVGEAKVVDGPTARVSDRIDVRARPADGQDWIVAEDGPVPVTFRGTAYSTGLTAPARAASAPAHARVIGTVEVVAKGPGTYEAHVDGAPAGFVTWVWEVVKKDQKGTVRLNGADVAVKDLVRADWRDEFGIPEETTSVREPVDVDSSIMVRHTKSGDYLVDDLYVTGLPDDHPSFTGTHGFDPDRATFTQTLLFFPEGLDVSEENRDRAEVIGSVEVPARNGYHPSVGSTVFRVKDGNPVGAYVFVTSFAGDDRVLPFTSDVTDPAERYVVVPEPIDVVTTASDADDGDKILPSTGVAHLRDRVCMTGLRAGHDYVLEGAVMDRASGEPVRVSARPVRDEAGAAAAGPGTSGAPASDAMSGGSSESTHDTATGGVSADGPGRVEVTGEGTPMSGEGATDGSGEPEGVLLEERLTFTASSRVQCVDMDFHLPALEVAGREFTVFERLLEGDVMVADHADLTSDEQSVQVAEAPTVTTTATVGGEKSAVASTEAEIVDRVCHTGLVAGREYTFLGVLMDAATGESVRVADEEIVSEQPHTPTAPDGCVDVSFRFDASSLGGHRVVVFEYLYEGEELIASHEDLSDEGQTVSFTPPPPKEEIPTTGVEVPLALAGVAVVLLGGVGMAFLLAARRRP